MADSVFNYEIECFISPIHGLYKEYIISVDELHEKNPELFDKYVVDTASVQDGQLIYELYGTDEEGEIMKEQVQTWICDNRQDVTRAVGITLRAKETSFSSWFRSSEDNQSPDELIIYCLSKMSQKHTAILNKSFAWSTLLNYIKYSDLEIVQRSSVVLVYVGINKYAILRPAWTVKPLDIPTPDVQTNPSKTRKRKTVTKTTCRAGNKRTKKAADTLAVPASTPKPTRRARTLAEKRLNQYGIKGGEIASSRTTRKRHVDYLKLNDGYDEPENEPVSPRPKRKRSYVPSRSGPSSTRQRAQTMVTSPPSRVLPCIPSKKGTTQSLKVSDPNNPPLESTPSGILSVPDKSTSSTNKCHDPVSGVQMSESIAGAQTNGISDTRIDGMQPDPVSGVQSAVSGVRENAATSVDSPLRIQSSLTEPNAAVNTTMNVATIVEVHAPPTSTRTFSKENDLTDAEPGHDDHLASDDKLPDLVKNSQTEADSYSLILDTVPPVGEAPPDNIFDGGTTEEEFDAVDALLSLSNIRDNAIDTQLDDNASLMPIDGSSRYQDVNPVTVHLDQTSVDGAIAKIVSEELTSEAIDNIENEKESHLGGSTTLGENHATKSDDAERSESNNAPISGVQNTLSGGQSTPSGVQTLSSGVQDDNDTRKDEEAAVEDSKGGNKVAKPKGYVKVTTHGIRRNTSNDSRSYRCGVCGIRKHHQKRHAAQMCGVCGKFFDLASSLSHHMYTHDERRFFCEKCSFHCHFESELKKHNISHHNQPSHQCMKRNCGRWFKHKADLVLHIETHNKETFECDECDFTTSLQKYLNEHKKYHSNTLPYACNICGKRFLWRSGVRAHKIKEHSGPKP